jgi:hypothetical protein
MRGGIKWDKREKKSHFSLTSEESFLALIWAEEKYLNPLITFMIIPHPASMLVVWTWVRFMFTDKEIPR